MQDLLKAWLETNSVFFFVLSAYRNVIFVANPLQVHAYLGIGIAHIEKCKENALGSFYFLFIYVLQRDIF